MQNKFKRIITPFFLIIYLSLVACVETKPESDLRAQAQWSFAPNAITLKTISVKDLNVFDGQPHATALKIYQINDPNYFMKLKNTPSMLNNVIMNGISDPSVLSSQQFFILPDQNQVFILDRVQDSKYIGVIAIFNGKDFLRTADIIKIPLLIHLKGIFIHEQIPEPAPINLEIRLGPNEIQSITAHERGY